MTDLPLIPIAALCAVVAFLSGSIPVGLLIAKHHGIDIRQHGSGNIGSTNVKRVLGKGPGRLCFILDVVKGFVPSLIAGVALGVLGSVSMPHTVGWAWLLVAIASVLGHVFSPWIGFKGGKGVATGLGSLVGVFPMLAVPGLLGLGVWFVALKVSRMVAVASVAAGLSLPVFAVAMVPAAGLVGLDASWTGAVPFMTGAMLLAVLVVWTHRGNLRRIARGEEPRIDQPKPSPATTQATPPDAAA